MRRFLVVGGVDGRADALSRLQKTVHALRPDGLLFAGGVFPHDARDISSYVDECEQYTKEGSLFMERFFSTLGSLGVFSAVIPGAYDAPIEHFCRQGMAAELAHSNIHVVHVTPLIEKDLAIFGLGACISDKTSTNLGYYSRALAEYYLRPLWTAEQPRKILLLSDVPEGWEGDAANTRLADELVLTYHPDVCVLGRPGAKEGVQRVGRTWLIHPGHLSEGSAAWLDWSEPAIIQCKLIEV